MPFRRVPYGLPKLIKAVNAGQLVHVVEGEKDVQAMERAGAVATCNPGGEGAGWRDEVRPMVRGAEVVIVADKDEPGRKHAAKVASAPPQGRQVGHRRGGGGGQGRRRPPRRRTRPRRLQSRRHGSGRPEKPREAGPAGRSGQLRRPAGDQDRDGAGDDPGATGGDRRQHDPGHLRQRGSRGARGEDLRHGRRDDRRGGFPAARHRQRGYAARARHLLAAHTYTYRIKTSGEDGGHREEVTPPTAVLAAALAPKEWPACGRCSASSAPRCCALMARCCNEPGYDEATGLYLASKIPLDPVPEAPTPEQVQAARRFLLGSSSATSPGSAPRTRPTTSGLLVTPILRSYMRTLIPFGVVTSTMPGSGKTILTCGFGMLYGQRVLTWPDSDEELRKAITSVLADPVGTIIFDNLAEGTVINSPVLARLITDRTWADRLLGGNKTAVVRQRPGMDRHRQQPAPRRGHENTLGPGRPQPGHAPARGTDRVRDPQPGSVDPGARQPAPVLWHLLVLVADWTRQGAPRRAGLTMRQFTRWAEAIGGFLAHHGIEGFLAMSRPSATSTKKRQSGSRSSRSGSRSTRTPG